MIIVASLEIAKTAISYSKKLVAIKMPYNRLPVKRTIVFNY